MKKREFKKQYSKYRLTVRQFQEKVRHMYCGDDDAAYERFERHTEQYLSDKPALRYAINNVWEGSIEESRVDSLNYSRNFDQLTKNNALKKLLLNK